ncbi:DNA binding domain protein, excisionase family (plasmid) [Thalassoporum mexicanum PCC 7367]|uniref:excisionase family DNA-binding protein n=1 Tax=Thalassoporum mexicanum TaxID=3457544 RepID=UPI00029FBEC5|nr:excisionase family DNA-binding protein [Pseudanabaena sp. PCC 7367]AFY72143.1 DNA binding domain protein, excisionase family [Pseudanabaena sp. PCC 7367]
MTLVTKNQPPITQADIDLAHHAHQLLAARLEAGEPLPSAMLSLGQESIELPAATIAMLEQLLEAIAQGKSVYIIPEHAELSTFEAADLLNVSRPYLIKLLNAGEIPYHKVGSHRRIKMKNLSAYKDKDDAERAQAIKQLIAEDQKYGLVGY